MTIVDNQPPILLSTQVKVAVDQYFAQLNGHQIIDLHALVLTEIEKPLFEATFQYSGYNQTKAAKILGISRSTLRKKLNQYGIA